MRPRSGIAGPSRRRRSRTGRGGAAGPTPRGAASPRGALDLDTEALLCALVLAPDAFSRNRFFALYAQDGAKRVRRRATAIRGIVRQLLGGGRDSTQPAEILGEQVLADGRVLVRYRIEELDFARTTALSAIEAAALRYALHRARGDELGKHDRALVESALEKLGADLDLGVRAARRR